MQEEKKLEEIRKTRLPNEKELEMFGLVIQMHGSDQVKVACNDGKERQCRIPGKLKKRVWIRQNDIVIIKLWDFQPSKADIVWRFFGHQTEYLKREGRLKGLPV
ncbi:MAG TPA: translation initiation factor eIF-1A [Candidatus Diapherotrites archaeon]|uniref:Translation initiation factor 1A n=1 Tax=Candidatus Iainarchaeum sp. TaxID=3101447 RepID=A0A7J4IXM2_9ARCH|nr:translation initiation factor eIF-1A [Candidatus Diapherotrites archaeon]